MKFVRFGNIELHLNLISTWEKLCDPTQYRQKGLEMTICFFDINQLEIKYFVAYVIMSSTSRFDRGTDFVWFDVAIVGFDDASGFVLFFFDK